MTTEALTKLVEEAIVLRFKGKKLPEEGQVSQAEVSAVLLDVRKRLDRCEELMIASLRVRGRARRHAQALKDDVEDSWAKAMEQVAARRNRFGGDYSGSKERNAEADLAVLEERIQQRKAQEDSDQAQEAYEVIRSCQRGLDTIRGDCIALIRASQFETVLER